MDGGHSPWLASHQVPAQSIQGALLKSSQDALPISGLGGGLWRGLGAGGPGWGGLWLALPRVLKAHFPLFLGLIKVYPPTQDKPPFLTAGRRVFLHAASLL